MIIRELDDDAARAVITERLMPTFLELVFSKWDPAFRETPEGKQGMTVALVDRYLDSRRHGVPWLDRAIDLSSSRIVEIGCGTGSSTVAMAEHCQWVVALDVDQSSVDAARARAVAHDVANVEFRSCPPEEILAAALAVADADVFVLFAVLEHLTVAERLQTLTSLWEALPRGGAIAIIETPNRLTYRDRHSSEVDFLHLLPDELAFRLVDLSPRAAYRDVVGRAAANPSPIDASVGRVRFGLGASFHEFLAALDEPLEEIVIADGYEDEITSWFGIHLDELLLLQYMLAESIAVPCAFARSVLNVVLRKPTGADDRSAAAAFNAARREALTGRYPLAPPGWHDQPAAQPSGPSTAPAPAGPERGNRRPVLDVLVATARSAARRVADRVGR
ncbi:MAG: class I SAM-dependent methyltransferase [Ilumatobacteraceae bacterium]